MKAIADFIAHKEDAVLHITTAERTNWNDANSKKHAHSNKSVIDGITQVLVDKWNSALCSLAGAYPYKEPDHRYADKGIPVY